MQYLRRFIVVFIVTTFVFLSFLQEVYAYLDPGTGSYIFQVMIALIIGGLFAIKLYWAKIKMFIEKLFSKRDNKK